MPNEFLKAWDRFICKTNGVAKFCKSINGKMLGILSTVIVCCTAVSFFGRDALKNIPVLKSAYYDTIVANCPQFVDFLTSGIGKTAVLILLSAVSICYLFRWLHRPFALLMAHSTIGHDLSKLDKSFKKSFWIEQKDFDSQLPSSNASEDQIVAVIYKQDELFSQIQKSNWRSTIFYYGVAHTPLVFRLGYQWGQTKGIRFLHRFRTTEDEQEFRELPEYEKEKVSFLCSNRLEELNYNIESEHLLVSIATTYPIRPEDLSCIDPSNAMLRYNIQVDMMAPNFFNSYCKIFGYVDRIVNDLRKIVKERNISTIHFAISSSVPFTFCLAQQMNTQQFKKIIVYHYDHGKYTWGIDIAESEAEKAVKWAKDTQD